MKSVLLLGIAMLVTSFTGCYNDKYDQLYVPALSVTCDTSKVSFSSDVIPILTANCNVSGGCHDAGGASTSGFDFTTYAGILPEATNDILVNDIKGTPSARHNAMPKNLPRMSDCNINKITAWVEQGALNN